MDWHQHEQENRGRNPYFDHRLYIILLWVNKETIKEGGRWAQIMKPTIVN